MLVDAPERALGHCGAAVSLTKLLRPSAPVSLLALVLLIPSSQAQAAPSIDPDLLVHYAARAHRPAGASALSPAEHARPRPPAAFTVHGQEWVDVWLLGRLDPRRVESLGGRIGTVAGDAMTAQVPLDAVVDLLELPGLEQVQLAQPLEFQSDKSIPEIGAQDLWGGVPPNFPANGNTGKGVVVGIVDTGIDPSHQDFRTASGSRIKWVWDQNPFLGPPPPTGFTYGSEYSQSAINSGAYNCSLCGDVDGHGTHLAGVAAGNGRATGNGKPAYTYMGVAPEADLVVVKLGPNPDGSVSDTRVTDGVKYVFQQAAALHEPAVVLLAVAKSTGPHDGQDPLDLAISALTGPGKIVCAAAGNYGRQSAHAEWSSTGQSQTGSMTVQVTPFVTDFGQFRAEAWYDPGASYSVSVITPSGTVVGPVARGSSTTVNTPSGIVNISNGQSTSGNGSYRVDLFVYRGNMSYPQVASGTWTYRFTSQMPGAARVDAWLTSYILGGTRPTFVTGVTEKRLVAAPATGNSVIAVGAYSTKNRWTALDGHTYGYSATPYDLADFSSPGPSRDGRELPHVTAPGYGVMASKSSQSFLGSDVTAPDGVHFIACGTSVAAAHAAGSVALLLRSNPTMNPQTARSSLEGFAATDSYTGGVPNDRWGWGKLRVHRATAGVESAPSGGLELALASANPSQGGMSFQFALAPEVVAARERSVRLRIFDVRGREVAVLPGVAQVGPQRLTWDGRARGQNAPAGMYVARLEVGSKRATRKFVRLQ